MVSTKYYKSVRSAIRKATQLDGLTLMQQSGKTKPRGCFFLNVLCISDPRKLHIKIIKLQITIDSYASRPNS
jgi:hypothetical protein